MVKFFTLPPREIPYPFILINANNPSPGLHYLYYNRDFVEEVIIDSGVEIFRDPGVKDYPPGHFQRLVQLYRRVKSLLPHAIIHVTIPDYPDDYHPGALWLGSGKTNIERTLDNILYALQKYKEVQWLIPVQGHYRDPNSIIYALELYSKHDIPLKYIAIANLCVEERVSIVNETVKLAWRWLWEHGYSNTRIHVFGPDTRSIHTIHNYIYSYDSTAWTRPRGQGWSAKNQRERVYLFLTYIYKHAKYIDIPLIPRHMRK